MSRTSTLVLALAISALVVVAAAGCSKAATPAAPTQPAAAAPASTLSGAALGKQIYTTGIGASGEQIGVSAPIASQGALMLGGGGCAACHGRNGHGATVKAAIGSVIVAPDITYAGLIKAGYTDVKIEWAMQWCQDQEGQLLDETMPCWQMTDEEAAATVAYMKTLK